MKVANTKNKKDIIYGPALAADVLVFTVRDEKLSILLIKISKGQYKEKWALPGGIVQLDETLDQASERILREKAGIKEIYLEQLYTFSAVSRDKRGRFVSTAYYALVNSDKFNLKTMEGFYSDIKWVDARKLPEMAFDHKEIINYGLTRLKRKIEYTNVAYGLLPHDFTLTEMQKVYEIIWGRVLDKRNFRKQIKSLNIIEPSGKTKKGEKNRPAKLHHFKKRDLVFTK